MTTSTQAVSLAVRAAFPARMSDAVRCIRRSVGTLSRSDRQLLDDAARSRYGFTALGRLALLAARCTNPADGLALPEALRGYIIAHRAEANHEANQEEHRTQYQVLPVPPPDADREDDGPARDEPARDRRMSHRTRRARSELHGGALMHPAKHARLLKELQPELYCPVERCLWRVITRSGLNLCRNHPAAQTMTPERADAIRAELYPEMFKETAR